jgi:hypothetical protein
VNKKIELLKTANLIPKLPDIFWRNESIPEGIVGVVQFVTLSDSRLVEGEGLVIDYRPSSSDAVRRVVIGSNDTAMWVEADFPLTQKCEGS